MKTWVLRFIGFAIGFAIVGPWLTHHISFH